MTPSDIEQLLVKAGVPPNSLPFALAQACFESGGTTFNSAVDKTDNNLTGITFCNASWQHNATEGIKMPPSDGDGHYAHFATLQDWASDFKRIIHAQFPANKEGRPIDATTIEDYVHRLKLNGYFGADETTYLNGLKYYTNILNKA